MDRAITTLKNALIISAKLIMIVLLLYVVLIIVFVVPTIFFGGHYNKARQTTCASNMKQIGLAIYQYAEDNDGNLPNIAVPNDETNTWRTMSYAYAKSMGMYLCPGHDMDLKNPDGFPVSYAANFTGSYSDGKNNQGDGAFAGPGSKPINTKDIPHPESLIMLCEVSQTTRPDFNIDALGAIAPDSTMLWAGHTNGSNYLFSDGHCKYLKPLDTKDLWHRDSSIPLSAGAVKVLQLAGERNGK